MEQVRVTSNSNKTAVCEKPQACKINIAFCCDNLLYTILPEPFLRVSQYSCTGETTYIPHNMYIYAMDGHTQIHITHIAILSYTHTPELTDIWAQVYVPKVS